MHARLPVVFDLESEPPGPLGTYIRTDEDTVIYRRPAGDNGYAPCDCVKVVGVDLFPASTTTTGGTVDELERKALAAADSMIAEHGWPWTLNDDGLLETATAKSRLMLASAFLKGYGYGVETMGAEADAAMRRMIADIKNT